MNRNHGTAIAAKSILIVLAFLGSSDIWAKEKYLCFEGISDKANMLCYPNTIDSEREAIVKHAVDRLGLKLDGKEPLESLATMGPDMANFYTQDKFEASLRKHFPLLGRNSIAHIVHHGESSALLLTDGSQLLFDHEKQSFIFGFNEPPPLAGLAYYYGRGSKPGTWAEELPISNCALTREGITFVAPARENLLYSQTGSFCAYDGYYFKPIGGKLEVRKVDQIGQGQSLISVNGLAPMLEWLKQGQ
ncbi:hypothetical protein ACONUD_13235 [Microbulbifer harenosus]|uniref:Uncharacterized protein n=1 Tax=Microbulbifer harenosus TaxID=2576840 RepID=A0ABY2ULX9_9GAMM|nr:hypothetical protein [Microbulbifer harenosus]TLM79374.1 hypothetical protein FDY93_04575 [Microbulbifer harenosus]